MAVTSFRMCFATIAIAAVFALDSTPPKTENQTWTPLNVTEKSDEQMLATYIARFKQKRAQQLATTEEILAKSEYEHRYKLSKALVDEMFKTLRRAQKVIQPLNLSLYPAVPMKNESLLGALIATWENTAFLSDLILRLPDMLHLQIDGHAVRTEVVAWALATCLLSPVFSDASLHTPLQLAQQELGLVPPDPAYTNPYRNVDDHAPAELAPARPRISRGPRLSDPREL